MLHFELLFEMICFNIISLFIKDKIIGKLEQVIKNQNDQTEIVKFRIVSDY